MRSIKKLKHEIEVATTFISNDRQTIVELEAVLADLGNVPGEAAKWRLEQSRQRKPINVLPLALNDKQREYESIRDTITAAHTAIEEQETKIARLKTELEEAEAAATDATWEIVSIQADKVAHEMQQALAVYTDLARKLFALNQLSRPGKSEYFTQETQRLFAPLPIDAPRTAYLQASDLDQFGYAAKIRPYVTAAQEWRAALIENPQAEYPAELLQPV